jgi:hypothetical protein
VFQSGFSEGKTINSNSATSEGCEEHAGFLERRRIIKVVDDYDTLHNILYFLYTGIIVFDTDPNNSQYTRFPRAKTPCRTMDVEMLHSAADRFLLTDLKKMTSDFLKSTCTLENITSRVFGESAGLFPDLDQSYSAYFKANLAEVMETKDFKIFFDELENSSDISLRKKINSTFRALVHDQLKDINSKAKG